MPAIAGGWSRKIEFVRGMHRTCSAPEDVYACAEGLTCVKLCLEMPRHVYIGVSIVRCAAGAHYVAYHVSERCMPHRTQRQGAQRSARLALRDERVVEARARLRLRRRVRRRLRRTARDVAAAAGVWVDRWGG